MPETLSRRPTAATVVTAGIATVALVVWTLAAAPAQAQSSDPGQAPNQAVRDFDRFIATHALMCLHEAAEACIDAAWYMADRDRNDRLSLDELVAVQSTLAVWADWRKPNLHENDWSGIQLGLLLVRLVGLDRLFAGFDTDSDLSLSQDELLADVTLDRRPLPQILTDRAAVDWTALAKRLGSFSKLLGDVVPSD